MTTPHLPETGEQETFGGQKMLIAIAVAIVLGGLVGGIGGESVAFFGVLGELFLRSLRMVVVPLVITSVIMGIGQLGDVRKLGRMGALTIAYYTATTFTAVTIGLILVNIVRPGIGVSTATAAADHVQGKATTLYDILLSFVPTNIIGAAANTDILPLITFSILFGAVLTTMDQQGRMILDFIDGLNVAIMKIVNIIIWFAPIGIFGLITGKLAEIGGGAALVEQLTKLFWYAVTVMGGLAIHATLVLGVLLFIVGKRSPFSFFRGMAKAVMTAFSTASSSATMPLTISCLENENQVNPKYSRFVVPLGATVNMDGTALYEAVAALFIAQAYGIELSIGQQVLIAVTATLASIGAAGIPEAGLVMMIIVLEAVGLPLEGIGMLLIIDWFLDRCRTSVNVWGDSVGVAVIAALDEQAPTPSPAQQP